MNIQQKICTLFGFFMFALLALCPPWTELTVRGQVTREITLGSHFIWHNFAVDRYNNTSIRPDFSRLLLELVAVVAITTGLLLIFRGQPNWMSPWQKWRLISPRSRKLLVCAPVVALVIACSALGVRWLATKVRAPRPLLSEEVHKLDGSASLRNERVNYADQTQIVASIYNGTGSELQEVEVRLSLRSSVKQSLSRKYRLTGSAASFQAGQFTAPIGTDVSADTPPCSSGEQVVDEQTCWTWEITGGSAHKQW